MVLDAADTALQETFQVFLRDLPAKSLRIVADPATGIVLSGTVLTITGTSPDSWNIPGPERTMLAIGRVMLSIADTGNGHALVTLNGHGVLHLSDSVSIHVVVASPAHAGQWWTMTADSSGSETLNVDDVFLLGTRSASPVDIGAIEPLTGQVHVVRDSLRIEFLPNAAAPAISIVTLHAGTSTVWELIPEILELNSIDVTLFMRSTTLGFRIVGIFRIGSTDLAVTFDIGPSPLWIATVEPVVTGKWPGIADLAELVGGEERGEELGTSIRDGLKSFECDLNALVLSKIEIGFNRQAKKLEYFDIATALTIKSIDLDVVLRLPHGELRGGLNEGKPLNVSDLLNRFGLEHTVVPSELAVSKLRFSAALRTMTYSFEIAVEGVWKAGPFQLRQIELHVIYAGSDEASAEVYGELSASLSVGTAEFRLLAEHLDRDSGWVFGGAMLEGSTISIRDLLDVITREFELPPISSAVGDLKLTRLNVTYNTSKNIFDFNCGGTFVVGGKTISATVTLHVASQTIDNKKSYTVHTNGTLAIGTSKFTVTFDNTKNSKKINVGWDDKTTPLSFADIARHFDLDVSGVPAEFLPTLSSVSFTYDFANE
ncbi:MAG TPA: hypothetical protein VHL50_10830, partial [Pyrinomonadaceae bacterium]|nr:hypothetical protein [Pyrinomonadaceae bacterium]